MNSLISNVAITLSLSGISLARPLTGLFRRFRRPLTVILDFTNIIFFFKPFQVTGKDFYSTGPRSVRRKFSCRQENALQPLLKNAEKEIFNPGNFRAVDL